MFCLYWATVFFLILSVSRAACTRMLWYWNIAECSINWIFMEEILHQLRYKKTPNLSNVFAGFSSPSIVDSFFFQSPRHVILIGFSRQWWRHLWVIRLQQWLLYVGDLCLPDHAASCACVGTPVRVPRWRKMEGCSWCSCFGAKKKLMEKSDGSEIRRTHLKDRVWAPSQVVFSPDFWTIKSIIYPACFQGGAWHWAPGRHNPSFWLMNIFWVLETLVGGFILLFSPLFGEMFQFD